MKIKTSELTGAALDWAMDRVENRIRPDGGYYAGRMGRVTGWSTNWAQGGPIIEREFITPYPMPGGVGGNWRAEIFGRHMHYGPTPLIAAMRCFVASKLGDEIEVPKELKS